MPRLKKSVLLPLKVRIFFLISVRSLNKEENKQTKKSINLKTAFGRFTSKKSILTVTKMKACWHAVRDYTKKAGMTEDCTVVKSLFSKQIG